MSNGGTMFAKTRRKHAFARACAFILAASVSVTWADPVKINFLPPPMEGTISLGIYDPAGKLVRVLAREAETETFAQADDALQTEWDGKDDAGNVLPAGTYRAKGVAVGDLGVSGEDYIGNDWVSDDDSPHLSRITDLLFNKENVLVLRVALPGERSEFYGIEIKPASAPDEEPEIKLLPNPRLPLTLLNGKGMLNGTSEDTRAGANKMFPFERRREFLADGVFWKIEKDAIRGYRGPDVYTLRPRQDDPPAVETASDGALKLYVLYENEKMQRLRGYDFTGVKPGDAPKVLLQNDIVFSGSYEQAAPQLKFPDGQPFAPSPVLNVALVRNPLLKKKQAATLPLAAVVDKEGAWIASADGLPLCKVSDTPHLRWAALGSPTPKQPVTFFDGDGAVVEAFQVSGIANMMTFDAGAYPWAPPTPSPSASPALSASPSATARP